MLESFVEYFRATSPLELVAVALAIAYLLVAIAASPWCWPLAFLSSALYVYLFAHAHLYMDGALNVYFAVMAGYGWYQWRHGGPGRAALPITRAPLRVHGIGLAVIAVATVFFGQVLGRFTNQAWPHVDSFVFWASCVTTYLAAKKYIDNWAYWIVIDLVAVPVYANRNLRVTAVLYAAYVVLAAVGWLQWHRDSRRAALRPA